MPLLPPSLYICNFFDPPPLRPVLDTPLMYVCMYMCVCVCVCMCIGVCVCMYVCMYVCMFVCIYLCMYVPLLGPWVHEVGEINNKLNNIVSIYFTRHLSIRPMCKGV